MNDGIELALGLRKYATMENIPFHQMNMLLVMLYMTNVIQSLFFDVNYKIRVSKVSGMLAALALTSDEMVSFFQKLATSIDEINGLGVKSFIAMLTLTIILFVCHVWQHRVSGIILLTEILMTYPMLMTIVKFKFFNVESLFVG